MTAPVANRGRVTAARVRGGRVLVDVTLVSGDTRSRVELLQPMGLTAVPEVGASVVVQEIGGRRGHLVAWGADDPALRITDAGPGQIGVQDKRGQRVVFRDDRIEVTSPLDIYVTSEVRVVVVAPDIRLGSASANKRVAVHGDSVTTGGSVVASTSKVYAE